MTPTFLVITLIVSIGRIESDKTTVNEEKTNTTVSAPCEVAASAVTLLMLVVVDCDSHVDRRSCIGEGVSPKELFYPMMLRDATRNAAEAVIDTLVVSILGDRCVREDSFVERWACTLSFFSGSVGSWRDECVNADTNYMGSVRRIQVGRNLNAATSNNEGTILRRTRRRHPSVG